MHTSFAAESGFLLGLVAVIAAPFSVMHAVTIALGAVALAASFVGLAATSRENVAGRALAPFGLAFAFVALILVGLRYLGVETAFGDGLAPEIRAWLESLNGRFPQP